MTEQSLSIGFLHWLIQISLMASQLHLIYSFNVDISSNLKYSGQPGSYFGFSTELLINSTGKWLLVGSPLAQPSLEPVVNRSGAIYKCELSNPANCEQMYLDRSGNSKGYSPTRFEDMKENQMLGFNMALSDDKDPRLAACAPLWINTQFRHQGYYATQGLCYIRFPQNILEYRPLLKVSCQIVNQDPVYLNAQAGFSVTYAKGKVLDKAQLVLGAPGLYKQNGGLVDFNGLLNEPDVKRWTTWDSYTGYSITSGNIYGPGKVSYVLGSPKFYPYGKILVISNGKYSLVTERNGEQFGSLFGGSVCTVDFDGDGLDDVVVGAPLYSTKMNREVGRVYVFTNQAQGGGLSASPITLQGADSHMSRFGQTVTNVGDLNQDSFEDLAVGAPFEDDFQGSIYIFNGGPNGVVTDPSQKIKGNQIDTGLRAFGWSISRGRDIDDNFYPDFSVGAFMSDNTVLLKTRPIVTLMASLEVNPPQINPKQQSSIPIDVRLCFIFDGKHVPPNLSVNYTLTSDISRRSIKKYIRAKFVPNGLPTMEIEDTIRLAVNTTYCQTVPTEIKPDRDLLEPIIFGLQFGLAENSSVTPPPLLNPQQNKWLTAKAAFANKCGDDGKCITDLKLNFKQAHIEGSSELVIGKTSSLVLHVRVDNSGEAAHEATLQIELPPRVKYVGVQPARLVPCTELLSVGFSSKRSISCDLGNPLDTNKTMDLEIKMNVEDVRRDTKALHFNAYVSSTSIEPNSTLQDNTRSITIYSKLDVDIVLKSESTPEQIVYDIDDMDATSDLNVTQTLTVMNAGPSVLPGASVVILLPHSDETGDHIYLDTEKLKFSLWNDTAVDLEGKGCLLGKNLVLPSGQLIQKELEPLVISTSTPGDTSAKPYSTTLPSSDWNTTYLPTSTYESPSTIGDGTVHRRKRDSDENHAKENSEIVKVLSCKSHRCLPVTCQLGQVLIGQKIKMNISLHVVVSAVALDKTAASFVYQTDVSVKPESRNDLPSLLNEEATIGTIDSIFIPSAPPQEEVTLWVIIVASVGGFLLLLLILFLLLKFGFFKRKKHVEVQDWKRKSGYSRRSKHSPNRPSSSQAPVSPTQEVAG